MEFSKDIGEQIIQKLEVLNKKLDEILEDEYDEEEFSDSSSS